MARRFLADFDFSPKISFAPETIDFENQTTLGFVQNVDTTVFVDENGDIIEDFNIDVSEIYVNRIDFTSWGFGDSTVSVDTNPSKRYEVSGTYTVSLSVTSEPFYDKETGLIYRVRDTKEKEVNVNLMSISWLKSHMTVPHLKAYETSNGFADLINSTSNMFDRMYKEIKAISDLVDIEHTPEELLVYFSDTLNHPRFYSKKIGYAEQPLDADFTSFLDYDIFNKIATGTASKDETDKFRQFIIDTSALFKQKGSAQSIEAFFRLYNFVTDVKEMWTSNFSTTTPDPLVDYFLLDPTLENTKNDFVFKGIGVTGWDNGKAQYVGGISNLLIDNYHYISRHAFPYDIIDDKSDECYSTFEINEYSPDVLKIQRDDGRSISSDDKASCNGILEPGSLCFEPIDLTCTLDGFDISKNNEFEGDIDFSFGVTYKIWQAPFGYVSRVVNVIGQVPNGERERNEDPPDPTDDYLWADWQNGATVPDELVGVSQNAIKNPVFTGVLPNNNFRSTPTQPNLFPSVGVETKGDNFVVSRGYIHIRDTGYYNFELDVGNTGLTDDITNQHVGLFSLSKTGMTLDEARVTSVDTFSFDRIPGSTAFSVTDDTIVLTFEERNTEYGLIEIRQNESARNSEFVRMTPGYYPYEIKSTYGDANIKHLVLSYEGWREETNESSGTTKFFNFEPKQVIATNQLVTVTDTVLDITESSGKGLLTIPNQAMEIGEIFKVSYSQPDPSRNNVSGIISDSKKSKDLEFNIRVKPELKVVAEEEVLPFRPRDSFQILFRGVFRQKDLYADIDAYYALIYDGINSEVGLAYVEYNDSIDGPIYRYLNLNPNKSDLDQRQFFTSLLDEDGFTQFLDHDKFYDFKLRVEDNKVTFSYRQNDSFSDARDNVRDTEEQDLINYTNEEPFITVFEDVELIQGDEQTVVYNGEGDETETADKYVPIEEPGTYGFAIQASSFLVNLLVVCPLDNVDENLLEDKEKWKHVSPKWLDSRDESLLQYNSYGVTNVEKPTSQTFRIRFADGFDGSESRYPLGENLDTVTDNSVDRVYADRVITDEWGSRFNVFMNREFMETNFESRDDALNRLLVPFGQFFEPTINWFRVGDGYTSGPAGYNPIVYENARILPHTIAASAGEVLEYTSHLTRTEDDLDNLFLNTKLNTHLKANPQSVQYGGIWEEVCPQSVNEMWSVDGGYIDNEVFAPIYRDTTTVGTSAQEIIGVRIINTDVHERLTCRYCKNATLWGLFDITYPEGINENYPVYTENPVIIDGTVRYFVPIGRLEEEKFIMLLPPEILRGDAKINMLGVYSHHSFEGFTIMDNDDRVQIQIDEGVYWENKYSREIICDYYLDATSSFVAKFEQTNVIPLRLHEPTPCEPGEYPVATDDFDANCVISSIPNAFYMPEVIENVFNRLENVEYPDETDLVQQEAFSREFEWWNPTQLWTERNIEVRYPDNNGTNIYSGLGNTTENPQGVPVVLENQDIDPYPSSYIADVDWCVSSVGWEHNLATSGSNKYGFGTFTDEVYGKIGFEMGEDRFTLDNEEIIKVAENMRAPIPLDMVSSPSTTGSTGSPYDNILQFGDIVNNDTDPNRSFVPAGLWNWYLVHANNEDFLTNENSRIGWDITEWNEEFIDCFKIQKTYYPLADDLYEINKYWAFYPEYRLPFEAIPRVVINQSRVAENCDPEDAPRVPERQITLGVSDGLVMFFNVPPLVEPYPKWRRLVSNVIVDNFTLPNDHYYVSVNATGENSTVVLNTQQFDFSRFYGPSEFFIELYSDRLFELTETTNFMDDFGGQRQIKWIPCVADERKYKIATRQPDIELKFTGDALPYSIVPYKNTACLKMEDKFEDPKLQGFSGTGDDSGNVGIFGNAGSRAPIYLTDIESSDYEFECQVIFDKDIVNTSFNKQFELILKAENNYVPVDKEWGLTDYYFVGFGTFNFDIGLGMRSINEQGETQETYLASWGEFNTRSIKPDVWYTIKAKVTTNSIKIFFNERGQEPMLVLNYNTNKKYEKLSERYLRGEWETLQAIMSGLEDLQITYPNKLGNVVSSEFTFANFKEEFSSTLPVDGFYVGFRTFNPMTYVGQVDYTVNKPRVYTHANTLDGTSLNKYLVEIDERYGISDNAFIYKYDKSLDFVQYILIDDQLYYIIEDAPPELYPHPVDTFYVEQDKIFVIEKEYPDDLGIGINYWPAPGRYLITWGIERGTDPYGIIRAEDFFRIVPHLTKVNVIRYGTSNVTELNENGEIVGSRIALRPGDRLAFYVDCENQNALVQTNTVSTTGGTGQPDDCVSIWALSGKIAIYDISVNVYDTRFIDQFPILIKDNTFYKDSVMRYEQFTEKKAVEVHINDNKFNLIFEDL